MKAVVFDFDGTLTQKKSNLWKTIWKELGYDICENSYYDSLLKGFLRGDITYDRWCELTCDAFRERRFTEQKLNKITDGIELIAGAEELIRYIHGCGVELHIVSGNIMSVIKKVLGSNVCFFSSINANEFLFDENGGIRKIIGTKYDHKGKAVYIKELCDEKGFEPSEVLFIGNSINDEWVYQSGAKTICVNPDGAKREDSTVWNKVICTGNLMDLKDEIK